MAYYSGPGPKRLPWPDEQWAVFVLNRAGTLADIEFDELSGALLEKFGSKIAEPNELSNKASNNWQPSILVGPSGDRIARNQVHVTSTEGLEKSILALHEWLSRTTPGPLFRGCTVKIDYEFVPANATGKGPPDDPGEYVTKVDFTVAWAKKLKGFHTLDELQRAAGQEGLFRSATSRSNIRPFHIIGGVSLRMDRWATWWPPFIEMAASATDGVAPRRRAHSSRGG
jgi:hypothetical protein